MFELSGDYKSCFSARSDIDLAHLRGDDRILAEKLNDVKCKVSAAQLGASLSTEPIDVRALFKEGAVAWYRYTGHGTITAKLMAMVTATSELEMELIAVHNALSGRALSNRMAATVAAPSRPAPVAPKFQIAADTSKTGSEYGQWLESVHSRTERENAKRTNNALTAQGLCAKLGPALNADRQHAADVLIAALPIPEADIPHLRAVAKACGGDGAAKQMFNVKFTSQSSLKALYVLAHSLDVTIALRPLAGSNEEQQVAIAREGYEPGFQCDQRVIASAQAKTTPAPKTPAARKPERTLTPTPPRSDVASQDTSAWRKSVERSRAAREKRDEDYKSTLGKETTWDGTLPYGQTPKNPPESVQPGERRKLNAEDVASPTHSLTRPGTGAEEPAPSDFGRGKQPIRFSGWTNSDAETTDRSGKGRKK
ncbi:MAG: hypothetical protein LBB38_03240 [Puniceicoccales bacterium]|nr:hypothetical protein [Puniceicoccales bacterium]